VLLKTYWIWRVLSSVSARLETRSGVTALLRAALDWDCIYVRWRYNLPALRAAVVVLYSP
jgi:hypothetical protein